jgi:hypothetical protein
MVRTKKAQKHPERQESKIGEVILLFRCYAKVADEEVTLPGRFLSQREENLRTGIVFTFVSIVYKRSNDEHFVSK